MLYLSLPLLDSAYKSLNLTVVVVLLLCLLDDLLFDFDVLPVDDFLELEDLLVQQLYLLFMLELEAGDLLVVHPFEVDLDVMVLLLVYFLVMEELFFHVSDLFTECVAFQVLSVLLLLVLL